MWSASQSLNRPRRAPDQRFCACALCAGWGLRALSWCSLDARSDGVSGDE